MLEIELLAGHAEGTFTVRSNIVDLRKHGLVPLIGEIQNAGFIHHMQIGLDLGSAESGARVEQVRVEQPYVAIESTPTTGGECCRDPIDRLLALQGESLLPGFEKHVTRLFGGPLGCSHLMTLGQTIGRALPSAIATEAAAQRSGAAARAPGERIFKRTVYIDGLSSQDGSEIQLALQQCDLTTAPHAAIDHSLERLEQQHEVQAHAVVAMDGLRLLALDCNERVRGLGDIGSDGWLHFEDRSEDVATLVGERIMPGLGSRLFGALATAPERRVLLDALLHLGPGFLQSIAPLGEALLGQPGAPPPVAGVGGNPNACYMWRNGGAMEQRREVMLARATSATTASETNDA